MACLTTRAESPFVASNLQSTISHLKLPRSFYLRPTLTVAKDLIGCVLVRHIGRRIVAGRIVEVEAYRGEKDPASHAYRGKTKRNEVMFRNGGYLYVYFTYGMHFCCNVVTEDEGLGRAVLIRAVEPLAGIAVMRKNRPGIETDHDLCNGPAKLCQAFAIDRKDNGTDLCGNAIYIAHDPTSPRKIIVARSTRVGISAGREKQWRFFEKGNPCVSRGRPAIDHG